MESHPGDETIGNSHTSSDVPNILSQSCLFPSTHALPLTPSEDFPLHLSVLECRICESPLREDLIEFEGCEHKFCTECMRDFLLTKIGEKDVDREFRCPAFQCESMIPNKIIERILSDEEKIKLAKFKQAKLFEADPFFRWCPRPDCTGYDSIVNLCEKLQCNVCNFTFCAYCHEEWHEGKECPQGKDKMLDIWLRENKGKFCPQCKMRVEKNEGCMHMTCITCRYEWCWRCGESYYNHENCIAAVKRHWTDYPFGSCFFLLFLPLIVPFAFVIIMFVSCGIEMAFHRTNKMCVKIIIGAFLILIGVAISPFGYIFVLLSAGHIVLFGLYEHSRHENRCCMKCAIIIFYLISGLIIHPFVLFGAACFIAISPIIGFAMLILKVVFMRKRPQLTSKVPGYPVT